MVWDGCGLVRCLFSGAFGGFAELVSGFEILVFLVSVGFAVISLVWRFCKVVVA